MYQVKLLEFLPDIYWETTQTPLFDIENLLEMCDPQTIRVKRLKVWQNLLQEPSETASVASPRLRRPKPPSSLLETKHRKLLASGMEATWDEWTKIWKINISVLSTGREMMKLTGTWHILEMGSCTKDGGYRDIRSPVFPSMLVYAGSLYLKI